VVKNDKDEIVATRTVTGWRICMDYKKLNKSTRKDHFPLPLIDQMLNRLAGQELFCLIDTGMGEVSGILSALQRACDLQLVNADSKIVVYSI